MFPPIFKVCVASPAVTALLGAGPTRLFPYDEAPQGVAAPYAVHQLVSGTPYNTLTVAESDRFGLQVDVYGATQAEAEAVVQAIRTAIERKAYIVGWNLNGRDDDTKLWRISFDVDWIVDR